MTAMRVKRIRRIGQLLAVLAIEVAQSNRPMAGEHVGLAPDLEVKAVDDKPRSWPARFVRKCLGLVASLRGAWAISRAALPPAAMPAPRARPNRDWCDVSGGQLSEG